jgi:hypothetical protein
MAEAKKEGFKKENKNSPNDTFIEAIYLLVFFGFVLMFLWGFFQSRTFQTFIGKYVPVSSFAKYDSPIGEGVRMRASSEVFSEPGGESLGVQKAGSKGKVAYGPEFFNGKRYWFVDFEDGPDGWVSEDVLQGERGGKFDPGDSPVGQRVYTGGSGTSVLGDNGEVIGSQPRGSVGTITKGPIAINGERYWYVNFDTGQDGWVKESALLGPGGKKINPGSTPVGEDVHALNDDTSVFDEPGGVRIGSQMRGRPGIIEGGPIYFNGEKYWYVNFKDGQDGWVKESELLIATKETFLSKIFNVTTYILKIIAWLLSILFLVGIIYSVIRTSQISAERENKLKEVENIIPDMTVEQSLAYKRWDKVLSHVQSENPAEWRLAVLEADIMLAEILERMGYIGENVGEKLKTVEKSDFLTIDDAWEAHKVRNLIAHEGSDYVLSKREAQRVVSLYANVFREFKYI